MTSPFILENVLADARSLVSRLKDHDIAADSLLFQTQELSKKVDSMKTYKENLGTLNELAKQRPQADIVLGLFQHNSEIGELERENAALCYSLDEHQLAIELIMSRYREQVTRLVAANRSDREKLTGSPSHVEEIESKINQICSMADTMWAAVDVDSQVEVTEKEQLTQLQLENATLRELLSVGCNSLASPVGSRGTQTGSEQNDVSESSAVPDNSVDWSSTVSASVVSAAHSMTPRIMRRISPRRPEISITVPIVPRRPPEMDYFETDEQDDAATPTASTPTFCISSGRNTFLDVDAGTAADNFAPSYDDGDVDSLSSGVERDDKYNVSVHTIGENSDENL